MSDLDDWDNVRRKQVDAVDNLINAYDKANVDTGDFGPFAQAVVSFTALCRSLRTIDKQLRDAPSHAPDEYKGRVLSWVTAKRRELDDIVSSLSSDSLRTIAGLCGPDGSASRDIMHAMGQHMVQRGWLRPVSQPDDIDITKLGVH